MHSGLGVVGLQRRQAHSYPLYEVRGNGAVGGKGRSTTSGTIFLSVSAVFRVTAVEDEPGPMATSHALHDKT